jgi:hypothetical protein
MAGPRLNHEKAKASVTADRFRRAEAAGLVAEHHAVRAAKITGGVPSPDAYCGVCWTRQQDGSISVHLRYLKVPIPGLDVTEQEYRRNGYRPPFESLPSRGEYMTEWMRRNA